MIDADVAPVFQLYVDAPLAAKVTVAFGQIVAEFTVSVGIGFTVTAVVNVPTHPPVVVPLSVYVVVTVGLAVTLAPLVELNPVPGDHV